MVPDEAAEAVPDRHDALAVLAMLDGLEHLHDPDRGTADALQEGIAGEIVLGAETGELVGDPLCSGVVDVAVQEDDDPTARIEVLAEDPARIPLAQTCQVGPLAAIGKLAEGQVRAWVDAAAEELACESGGYLEDGDVLADERRIEVEELLGQEPRRTIPGRDSSERARTLSDRGVHLLRPRWFPHEIQLVGG